MHNIRTLGLFLTAAAGFMIGWAWAKWGWLLFNWRNAHKRKASPEKKEPPTPRMGPYDSR